MAAMRTKGEGTYYRRGDLFAWKLRRNGRTVVRTATTLAALRRKVRRALDDLDSGAKPVAGRMTVADYASAWLRDVVEPTRSPSTMRGYEQIVRLYVAPTIGPIRLADLTTRDCQRVLSVMTGRGLSGRTADQTRIVLRRMLGQAVADGLIPMNPATGTARPRQLPRQPRALRPEQVAAITAAVDADPSRYATLIGFLLATGLRITEALALTWSDVLDDRAIIRRRIMFGRGAWSFETVKTAAGVRVVPLTPRASAALARQRRTQDADRSHLLTDYSDHGLVWTTSTGYPMQPRNVQRTLDAILVRLGIPHVSLQDLRRTFGTSLARAGTPDFMLKAVMGHADIRTTKQFYAVAFVDDLAATMNKVEESAGTT